MWWREEICEETNEFIIFCSNLVYTVNFFLVFKIYFASHLKSIFLYLFIAEHIWFFDGDNEGDSLMLQPDATWNVANWATKKRSRACAVSYSFNKVALIGGREGNSGPKLV